MIAFEMTDNSVRICFTDESSTLWRVFAKDNIIRELSDEESVLSLCRSVYPSITREQLFEPYMIDGEVSPTVVVSPDHTTPLIVYSNCKWIDEIKNQIANGERWVSADNAV